MSDVIITGPGLYKRRDGELVNISTNHSISHPFRAQRLIYTPTGFWNQTSEKEHDWDIVSRVPSKGQAVVTGQSLKEIDIAGIKVGQSVKAKDLLKPHTSIATDGNAYPSEWWIQEQRFDEHEPPENVDIRVTGEDHGVWNMRMVSGLAYNLPMHVGSDYKDLADLYNCTWTLAPNPPKEKQVASTFRLDGFTIPKQFVLENPDEIDALYAWKNHITSKSEGV